MSKHILIAEDNLVNQSVAKAFVSKVGYQVTIAVNGVEAVEKFIELRPDMVLMDCNMPEMDGMDATRKIREYEQQHELERTPIVALTAHAFSEVVDDCFAAGMDGHLAKPIIFDKLRETLAQHLG